MSRSTVFVAVHGIGDQVRNETIQAVARRVYAWEGAVAALPLGSFPSRQSWNDDIRDEYIRAIARRVFVDPAKPPTLPVEAPPARSPPGRRPARPRC